MLMPEIESYLASGRALGFALACTERRPRAFARFAAARGDSHVRSATAIAWAAQAVSPYQRSRRLKDLRLFARYLRADDPRHEIPPGQVFGSPIPRRLPYTFSSDDLKRILRWGRPAEGRDARASAEDAPSPGVSASNPR